MANTDLAPHNVAVSSASRQLESLLAEAADIEVPKGRLCLELAQAYTQLQRYDDACHWLSRVVDAGDDFLVWTAASSLLARIRERASVPATRRLRVSITGSYTLNQLAAMTSLAALRRGLDIQIHEGGFDQYQQDLLNPSSRLYESSPEVVVVATHEGALELPSFSESPEKEIDAELARWSSLWASAREHSAAHIVQHNFAIPPDQPLGHLAARLAGSRYAMTQELNGRLGGAGGDDVVILDCDRLAGSIGKNVWFDDRYWYQAKQAVGMAALPLLARNQAAVIAGVAGLSKKCLVLDLDNTLWGGVVGEDGLAGLRLGAGADGEAYCAFQSFLLQLQRRGVVLAVASKNNDADARAVFEDHPDMRLRISDFAAFVANWDDKATNLRAIAETLDLGLDALVFVDDNAAERQLVRRILPEVEVVTLPPSPARYAHAIADSLLFETPTLTAEDAKRTDLYRARAAADALRSTAATVEDFLRALDMEALIEPFDELHLPRIAQLVGKTNQLNLTTRRHSSAELQEMSADPDCVTLYLKLRDKLADHGLVGVVIAKPDGDVLEIDTLLLSCRVIGRTAERALLGALCRRAQDLGYSTLRGVYIRSSKNEIAARTYADLGFACVLESSERSDWEYRLDAGSIESDFIGEWRD